MQVSYLLGTPLLTNPGPGAEATEATEAADGPKSEVSEAIGEMMFQRLGKWNF